MALDLPGYGRTPGVEGALEELQDPEKLVAWITDVIRSVTLRGIPTPGTARPRQAMPEMHPIPRMIADDTPACRSSHPHH